MGVFHKIASHAYTMYCFRENNSQENTCMRASHLSFWNKNVQAVHSVIRCEGLKQEVLAYIFDKKVLKSSPKEKKKKQKQQP